MQTHFLEAIFRVEFESHVKQVYKEVGSQVKQFEANVQAIQVEGWLKL